MKKLASILSLLALCYVARAQTNSNAIVLSKTNDVLYNIGQVVSQSGILSATNYAFEPYATYAPSAPKGSKVGGGLFAAYNINDYVGVGLGMDYLGQFSLVSANCQIKYAMHPVAAYPNFAVIPFGIAGIGTGFGNGGAIAVTDVGAYMQFGHLWGGKFNVGGAYGRWDNAGAFSGIRYHIFTGWSKGF